MLLPEGSVGSSSLGSLFECVRARKNPLFPIPLKLAVGSVVRGSDKEWSGGELT